ncbi:MAG: class II aldolase/adducin family protein [Ardenticatenales bacterium]|nr:class II aldolase/adducin family protein [Ardenticatenales bacterium]
MIDQRLYEEFRDIAIRDIFVTGLTSSHGGNMSVRVGDKIIIKRRGAQFGRLKRSDFVETSFQGKDSGIVRSQHRADRPSRYLRTNLGAGDCPCPPRTAIVLSLSQDEIILIDNEGSYLLRKIPVVSVEMASGSKEMAKKVSESPARLQDRDAARPRLFLAIGQTLEEAYHWVSALEEVRRHHPGTQIDGRGDARIPQAQRIVCEVVA